MSKSERTRQLIIEKVAPVFNRKGFAGTSLSDLTAVTKLTKGAIYGHFKNKDELALAAFQHNIITLQQYFVAEFSTALSAIEKIRKLPIIYRKTFPHVLAMGGCPLLNTISDTDDSQTSASLKTSSLKALKRTRENIEKIVQEAIDEKSINAQVNPEEFASLVLILIEGGILMAKAMQKPEYFENALKEIELKIQAIQL